jgi:hypothetical protein
MTEVSVTVRERLSACAEVMSRRQDGRNIDLYSLNHGFHQAKDAIVAFLAEEVERITQGKLTVRRADPALFDSRGQADTLSLAVCPAASAPELVTELNSEVTLYTVSPYRNGFRQQQAATPQAVTEGELEDRWRAEGRQSAEALMAALFTGIQRLATSTEDTRLHERLESLLAGGPTNLKLEQAATACAMTGTDFMVFVYEALPTV